MPIITTIRQIMLGVGWALLLGNLVFQATRSMMAGVGFEADDPKLLFTRTFVFSFLLVVSPQICDVCLNMTSVIICCLDESGSTEGEAAAWGKAVAMTLLEIAAESHRSFALIHFAGSSSCQVDIFRPGEYTLEDKLSAAETFLGGGTNFERPIREAIRLMESEGFEKADVVFITDGECALSDGCQQELQASQAAHHFTVTGILLDKGRAGMGFSLSPFCQKIYRTSELTGDAVVQSVISLRV